MKDFYKVIMPGTLPEGQNGGHVTFHIGITYKHKEKGGCLSITGVIGAKSNGDAWGSCGQCVNDLKITRMRLADGWTASDVKKLRGIWERWHLNDMNALCEHQRMDGWQDKARQYVTLYHWSLNDETGRRQRKLKNTIDETLKLDGQIILTDEQHELYTMPYFLETWAAELPEDKTGYYKPYVKMGARDNTEIKQLNGLKPEEHPEGILCRPCPVCGYKWGTSWLFEEVPEDILEWLFNLPESAIKCAWGRM